MAKSVLKEHEVSFTVKDVLKRYTLNYTDIVKNNNKFYNLEIQETTDNQFCLYTNYGRLGGTSAKEYRICENKYDAEIEAEKIVKSKLKKGYVEVKLVKAEVGSEIGKSKIEASTISEDTAQKLGFKIVEEKSSLNLHPSVQDIIKNWFGSVEQFIIDTLDTSKCVLGQLSLDQINKGRDFLLEARNLVNNGAVDITELNNLSSKYYSNIPMNFGYRRLDVDQLRLDTHDKLDKAFDILDTLEGAKGAEKVLNKRSSVDEKYLSLKTEIEYLDPKDPIYKWIELLFHKTRSSNHHFLGKIKIDNIFKLTRKEEFNTYINMVESMAGKNNKRVELPDFYKPLWNKRPLEDSAYEKLFNDANIIPAWHGTRTENYIKILPTKLLFRKPGFTVAGSMYDNVGGLYFSNSSTKSINYTSCAGSYWSGGTANKGYMFLTDVALGKQKIAKGPYPYTSDCIKPCMSVWAKGGVSGVINDEFIVYTEKQNWLRYIVEFEAQVR